MYQSDLFQGGFVAAGGWTGTGEEIGDTFPTSRIDFYDFETGIYSPGNVFGIHIHNIQTESG